MVLSDSSSPNLQDLADMQNVQDVASILAIDKSLKQMQVMRLWWRVQKATPQQLFYQMSLGTDEDLIKSTLSADNNQCAQLKIPTN
jgi:hypothetical protein